MEGYRLQVSAANQCARIILEEKFASGVAVGSRPPCFEPRGSELEEFGLETEPTSADRRNQ